MREKIVLKYFENNSRSKHFIEQYSWKMLKQKLLFLEIILEQNKSLKYSKYISRTKQSIGIFHK